MQDQAAIGAGAAPEEIAHQLYNLRAFLVAADGQSIAGAARQLYRVPSAITRSVAELEKALGLQLFERTPRRILLNGFGLLVLARARRIHAELRLAAAELARLEATAGLPASTIDHLLFNGRKLRLLAGLADRRRVSAAAAALGMSQSGASMALARIEAALGLPLFQRSRSGLVPTDAADRLVLRAKRVFAEFRHMLSDLSAEAGTLQGSVVVGAPPLGRTHILPAAITAALARHPAIRITMVDTAFEQLVAGLRAGDVDAIVGVPRSDGEGQGLALEPLFADRLTIIARAEHPLAGRRGLALADLLGERWILPWSTSPSRTLFDAAFRRAGLPPPAPSVETADLAMIRQLLVSAGLIAFASARQFLFELRSGRFVELDVALAGMTREVALITREGAMLSPAALALLDAIRQRTEPG